MMHLYSFIIFLFSLFVLQSCNEKNGRLKSKSSYPSISVASDLKQDEQPIDSLKIFAEIDIWDNGIPVGQIAGVEMVGDELFFADSQHKIVHVINSHDLKYKRSIGGGTKGPYPIYRLLGFAKKNDELFILDGSGPDLFKAYHTFRSDVNLYTPDSQVLWPLSMGPSTFFLSDSLALVVKGITENGKKVIKYNITDGEAEKLDEIVAVDELTTTMDSAHASTAIVRMSILESNLVEKSFYVLPSDKYLINHYSFQGELISSLDLRDIPVLRRSYDFFEDFPINSLYQAAVIDKNDNIYFHVSNVSENTPQNIEFDGLGMYLVSLNLEKKSYRLYPMDARSVTPLGFAGDLLWCFDFTTSKLIAYGFN